MEACELATHAEEQPSDYFLEKLRSLSSTGHHVDTALTPKLWQAHSAFWVATTFLSANNRLVWFQNRRWAGPCTGLVALFYSKAVQDSDLQNAVDLYELRYRTEAEARRVATLLEDAWDWNYHPFVSIHAGRSVIVAEGRQRAEDALARLAAHFGGKLRQTRALPAILLCVPGKSKPLVSIASADGKNALLAHALGFSPSGRFAWLEGNTKSGTTTWSLHIQDLVNDRQLAVESYSAGDETKLCSQHAKTMAERLAEHGIRTGTFTRLDGLEAKGEGPKLTVREAGESQVEVVLVGSAKSSVIGKIPQPVDRIEALGLLRSPFEARSVAWVIERGAGSTKLHVFGGRLDKIEKK